MDMICPKCGQSFEKGSRRFCPTDGRRLVSEEPSADAAGKGVFANLIPQFDAISDLTQTNTRAQRPPEHSPKPPASSGVFFEIDEPATDPFAAAARPAGREPTPAARKIDPNQIPAGHVDLADTDRLPPLDFDEAEPERFVGRIVKGRYQVAEFLGGDENGLAYVADDKLVEDKKVVVRILTGDGQDEITESLLAEERVSLSHLAHPNIARLVDSGAFTDGTPFLITEYVDALSVRDILSIHGHFDPQRAARVIRQAASALNEAHQEGVLHRDIRPENVIVDAAGEAELITLVNFGASDGRPTPHNFTYRAPEVLEGRAATAASDIFSLGVVAFEMLTGRLPFAGNNVRELLRAQPAGPAVNASNARPGLPQAVDGVLDRALAYDPAERYFKARDLGDALAGALATATTTTGSQELPTEAAPPPVEPVQATAAAALPKVIRTEKLPPAAGPAWKNRSPEPPAEETSRTKLFAGIGLAALVTLLVLGWYLWFREPAATDLSAGVDTANSQPANTIVSTTEMPPPARTIPQPPNTSFYQNSKQNLKGDLLINFVGFTLYYPKEWKVNGPQPGTAGQTRGKFLDISRNTADDLPMEQMLISYYPSKGTFTEDAEKFPQLAKDSHTALRDLIGPSYTVISEGPITVNGGWRAYEIKFQGTTEPGGKKLTVWGRRLFVPAARPGVKNGFEITMLATSLAEGIQSVDDVGVRGELAGILYTFEPSQNF
jgi:serine/threonine protein kinase